MERLELAVYIDALAAIARMTRQEASEWAEAARRVDRDVEATIRERDEARRLHDEHCVRQDFGDGQCVPPWREPNGS